MSAGAEQSAFDPLDSRAGWSALGRAHRQSTSEASLREMEDLVESRLRCPTLVLWGAENRLLPAAGARVIFRERRNVRFVEVAGAGHAVHEDEPEVVAELIQEFLE